MPFIIANVGAPIVFFTLPVALYLLIPVIALETWITYWFPARTELAKILLRSSSLKMVGLSSSRRLSSIVLANAMAALSGWLLMGAIFVGLRGLGIPTGDRTHSVFASFQELAGVAMSAAWLILHDNNLYWMAPAAAVVLMVPVFIVTTIVKEIVLKLCWRKVPLKECTYFVLFANVSSFGLVLGLIWLLCLTTSIALSIAIVVAVFCIAWTGAHRPREKDLGSRHKAKMREFMVGDIRASAQYCSWYIALTGVIATMVASHPENFRVILNQDYLWPFGVSFLAASMATVFFPAGYGAQRFKALRTVWYRSVLCEQMVVVCTCYGVCNAFVALTSGQGLP